MASELRSSQRTVKSCTFCARRKVKCDKNLPCRNCRVRGQAESCAAELVRVKGRPPSADDAQPTYAELLDENRALREELTSLKADPRQRPARPGRCIRLHKIDDPENSLYNRLRSHSRELTVKRNEDVVLPSKQLSQCILNHGANWVPWVNCSLNPAELQKVHDKFFSELGEAGFNKNSDPAWLGLYFAYLTAGLVCETASWVVSLTPTQVSVLFLTLPEAKSMGVSKGGHSFLCLICRENYLLIGPPFRSAGTIPSQLVRCIRLLPSRRRLHQGSQADQRPNHRTLGRLRRSLRRA